MRPLVMVGQIFDEFGLEEIISLVAHGVGDGHAHGAERVGAVAAAGTQIAAAHGHRVDEMVQPAGVGQQLDGVDEIFRAGGHAVEHFGFLLVFALDEAVGGFPREISVVGQDLVDHMHAHFGPDVADKHRLADELLVEPVAESRRRIAPVVVDPQPQRKRIAQVGRIEAVVGLDIDGRKHGVGEAGRRILILGGRLYVDLLDTGIEDVVGAETARGGAAGGYEQQQCGRQQGGQRICRSDGRVHCFTWGDEGSASVSADGFLRGPKRNMSRSELSLRLSTKPTPVWVISPSRMLS